MKKLVFILLSMVLTSCGSDWGGFLQPQAEDIQLQEENYIISPKKEMYSVGDTINLKIVFPERFKKNNGFITDIGKPHTKDLSGSYIFSFLPEENFDDDKFDENFDFIINDIVIKEKKKKGYLNFVYDETNKTYLCKDKIQYVFKKQGEFPFSVFMFEPYVVINKFVVIEGVNKTDKKIKVE